jgi:hypothetical protein
MTATKFPKVERYTFLFFPCYILRYYKRYSEALDPDGTHTAQKEEERVPSTTSLISYDLDSASMPS